MNLVMYSSLNEWESIYHETDNLENMLQEIASVLGQEGKVKIYVDGEPAISRSGKRNAPSPPFEEIKARLIGYLKANGHIVNENHI